jgi:hypothetical protein
MGVKPREDEPEKPLRNFTAGCHRASGGTGGGAIPTGPAQRSFTSKTNPLARTLTVTAAGDKAVTAPRRAAEALATRRGALNRRGPLGSHLFHWPAKVNQRLRPISVVNSHRPVNCWTPGLRVGC